MPSSRGRSSPEKRSSSSSAFRNRAAPPGSARQAEIQERRQTVSDEAAVVQRELDQQRAEMDSEDLAIYDHQRGLHPVAVAAVEGGVCGACRLSLPTTVLIRARRGTAAVHCPSCSCIVYVP